MRNFESKVSQVMTSFFSKARAYFDFRQSVITGYQHIFDDVAQNFLDAVAASLPSRFYTLEEGSPLSRARRGCEWKPRSEDCSEAVSFTESGMKPDADKTSAGRANSIRKPVFYGATDDKTAVSEIRPWIGALVSVGRFRALKELQLVN